MRYGGPRERSLSSRRHVKLKVIVVPRALPRIHNRRVGQERNSFPTGRGVEQAHVAFRTRGGCMGTRDL